MLPFLSLPQRLLCVTGTLGDGKLKCVDRSPLHTILLFFIFFIFIGIPGGAAAEERTVIKLIAASKLPSMVFSTFQLWKIRQHQWKELLN